MAGPLPLNTARCSEGPTSGASSQAHATPPIAAATTGGSASVASISWPCQRRSPIVARRASVISRVLAVSSSDSSRTSAPNPAATAVPWSRAVFAARGTGAVASASRVVARSATVPPGSARRTAAVSRAASRPGPATSIRSGPGGRGPSARRGSTTTPFPLVPGAPGTAPACPASRIVTVPVPTVRLAGARPISWAAAAVATAGTTVALPDPGGPDSASSGKGAPGARSTTAAYEAGSVYTTDSTVPAGSPP